MFVCEQEHTTLLPQALQWRRPAATFSTWTYKSPGNGALIRFAADITIYDADAAAVPRVCGQPVSLARSFTALTERCREPTIARHNSAAARQYCGACWSPVMDAADIQHNLATFNPLHARRGGSVAEWLACWIQAQEGPGSNRSRDAVG